MSKISRINTLAIRLTCWHAENATWVEIERVYTNGRYSKENYYPAITLSTSNRLDRIINTPNQLNFKEVFISPKGLTIIFSPKK